MKDFNNYFAADFETVNYDGCQETEVWSASFAELYSNNEPIVYTNLDDFMNYFMKVNIRNSVIYFHNCKFDGSFIVDWLLKHDFSFHHCERKDLQHKEFDALISRMGRWYSVTIKYKKHTIELRDSLKLLPMSLSKLGKSFKLQHQKLEMDYTVHRHANEYISQKEMEYIKNDIYVLKEALEFTFSEGHTKLTIGSCCYSEYKSKWTKDEWETIFPNVYDIPLDKSFFDETKELQSYSVGEYCHQAYKGAFTYLKPEYSGKIVKNGKTIDACSLYPSQMHSKSGNRYPIGHAFTFKPEEFDSISKNDKLLYFVRIRTRFELKPNHLPTIQIKGNPLYNGREFLTTSDVKGKDGTYSKYYVDYDGTPRVAYVELSMTKPDFELFKAHYNIKYLKILDGIYFKSEIGLFDEYINKYMEIKMYSKNGIRELSKLYLNNLYGRFATYIESTYKEPYLEDGIVKFNDIEEYDKKPGYIPVGAYITAYARYHTITRAQLNYDAFIYCDTDSIHMLDMPIKGIPIHPSRLCTWKVESKWDMAKFVRAKTYVERIIVDGNKPIKPAYLIKCAGMPDKCKRNFCNQRRLHYMRADWKKEEEEQRNYELKKDGLDGFDYGLKVKGKLLPKRVKGGIILQEGSFVMHKQKNMFSKTISKEEFNEYFDSLDDFDYTSEKTF